MTKFKVGDQVRYIEGREGALSNTNGIRGTIKRITDNYGNYILDSR